MSARTLARWAAWGAGAWSGLAAAAWAGEPEGLGSILRRLERIERRLDALERREVPERPALQSEIERLREELRAVEARTVPAEPAQEIRRATAWVCERGHVFEREPDGGLCPFDGTRVAVREEYRKVALQRRERISEIVEARLEEESRRRVAVGMSATGIVQQSLGSGPDRLRGSGSADVLLLGRPAAGSTFFVDLEAIGGEGLDSLLGSASGLNADAGSLQDEDRADRLTVREVWLGARLVGGRLEAAAGKLDLTNDFDRNEVANDETRQFLSAMFVNNPLLGRPVEGAGHEANAPGLRLGWDTFRGLRFGAGLQAPENSGAALGRTPYGIGELRLLWQRFGGAGNARLWLRREGGSRRSRAVGLSLDQAFASRWRLFSRWGFAFGGQELDRHAWSAGFDLASPHRLRPRDRLGVAYGWLRAPNGRVEDLAELYWRAHVTDRLALSPALQYAFHLAGDERVPRRQGVLVGGLRTQLDF